MRDGIPGSHKEALLSSGVTALLWLAFVGKDWLEQREHLQ
jgi:hypothetical protein